MRHRMSPNSATMQITSTFAINKEIERSRDVLARFIALDFASPNWRIM